MTMWRRKKARFFSSSAKPARASSWNLRKVWCLRRQCMRREGQEVIVVNVSMGQPRWCRPSISSTTSSSITRTLCSAVAAHETRPDAQTPLSCTPNLQAFG